MNDVQPMNVLNSHHNLRDILGRCGFLKPLPLTLHQSFVQFALLCVFKHEVDGEFVLKVVVKLDDVRVIETVHDLYLGTDVFDHLLTCY